MRGMRVRAIALGTALALGGAGFAGIAPAAAAAPAAGLSVAQSDEARVSAVDRAYLIAAHDGNLNEILASRIALRRSSDERVRELARMFIAHHTRLDRRVQRVADGLGVDLPDGPSALTRLELALLRQVPRADFDRTWLVQQLGSHARTILATEIEIALGQRPWVLGTAEVAAPVVRHHYRELRRLATKYGIHVPPLEDLARTADLHSR